MLRKTSTKKVEGERRGLGRRKGHTEALQGWVRWSACGWAWMELREQRELEGQRVEAPWLLDLASYSLVMMWALLPSGYVGSVLVLQLELES